VEKAPRLRLWLSELRADFFPVSVMPVLVGTSAAYADAGTFRPGIFGLSVLGMLLLHAGANVTNDYFDHLSGSDRIKDKENPYAGGSQLIQRGLLSPAAVLSAGLVFLAAGVAAGLALAWLVRSLFVAVLTAVGLFGAYFYTAPPLRIGYTPWGSLVCGLCFGPLPVAGAFYLQTGKIDAAPIVPGLITGILLFLVLLVNGFPDEASDRATGKRTLVVALGARRAERVLRLSLAASFVLAAVGFLVWRGMLLAGGCYLSMLPFAWVVSRRLHVEIFERRAGRRAGRSMILLHLAGAAMLTAGLFLSGLGR
jgi:1,4-dihydroxy-2-naphthoate octaprenyltransferase